MPRQICYRLVPMAKRNVSAVLQTNHWSIVFSSWRYRSQPRILFFPNRNDRYIIFISWGEITTMTTVNKQWRRIDKLIQKRRKKTPTADTSSSDWWANTHVDKKQSRKFGEGVLFDILDHHEERWFGGQSSTIHQPTPRVGPLKQSIAWCSDSDEEIALLWPLTLIERKSNELVWQIADRLVCKISTPLFAIWY